MMLRASAVMLLRYKSLLHSAEVEPTKPQHRGELKHVLFPRLRRILFSKFARKDGATFDVLRADEITGYLDAVGQIDDLRR